MSHVRSKSLTDPFTTFGPSDLRPWFAAVAQASLRYQAKTLSSMSAVMVEEIQRHRDIGEAMRQYVMRVSESRNSVDLLRAHQDLVSYCLHRTAETAQTMTERLTSLAREMVPPQDGERPMVEGRRADGPDAPREARGSDVARDRASDHAAARTA
jgi:hypothetical protein